MKNVRGNIEITHIKNTQIFINQLIDDNQLTGRSFANISISNVQDATVNIAQYLAKSAEYTQLTEALDTSVELLKLISLTEAEKRLNLSKKIETQKALIRSFEQDVARLADTFNRIELRTDRQKQAKAYFDAGQIREADAIIKTEDLDHEYAQVEEQERKAKALLKTTREKRHILSDEYQIKAQALTLKYETPDRIEQVVYCYKKSIQCFENEYNCSNYGDFLDGLHQVNDAKVYYRKSLDHLKKKGSTVRKFLLYAKLGSLESFEKNIEAAWNYFNNCIQLIVQSKSDQGQFSGGYEKLLYGLTHFQIDLNKSIALTENLKSIKAETTREIPKLIEAIQDSLSSENDAYLQDPLLYGKTLKNLAWYFQAADKNLENAESYYKIAIRLLENIQQEKPAQRDERQDILAELYCHFGQTYLQSKPDEAIGYFSMALKIYTKFAETNPERYLIYIAYCQKLLAVTYAGKNQIEDSIKAYLESISIYEEYAEREPQTFNYHLAELYNWLSGAYDTNNDWEKSLDALLCSAEIYQELFDRSSQQYMAQWFLMNNQLTNKFYSFESAGKDLTDFSNDALITSNSAKHFDYIFVLFDISNIYARNQKKHLVPWVLSYIETSFRRIKEPNIYAIQLAMQVSQYHGDLLQDEEKFQEAAIKYERGIELCEQYADRIDTARQQSLLLISAGDAYMNSHNHDQAILCYEQGLLWYEQAVAEDLNHAQALLNIYGNLRYLYANQESYSKAQIACEKRLALLEKLVENYDQNPLYVMAVKELMLCQYHMNQKEDSIHNAMKVILLSTEIRKNQKWKGFFDELDENANLGLSVLKHFEAIE